MDMLEESRLCGLLYRSILSISEMMNQKQRRRGESSLPKKIMEIMDVHRNEWDYLYAPLYSFPISMEMLYYCWDTFRFHEEFI
jgi:hypothetical protein